MRNNWHYIRSLSIILFLVLLILSIDLGMCVENDNIYNEKYRIVLKSRSFIPSPIAEQGKIVQALSEKLVPSGERHILIQFYRLPTIEDVIKLKRQGIELLDYIPNYTYIAKVNISKFKQSKSSMQIRWMSELLSEDKISPDILQERIARWAINPDGTISLRVKFFNDVSKERAEEILGRYTQNYSGPQILNYWIVTMNRNEIYKLATEDEVQWIELIPPPPTALKSKRDDKFKIPE